MSIFSQVFGDSGFDSNTVEPQDNFDALPPGNYPVVIEKAEIKSTKKGDGHYLEVCVQVTDDCYRGRKLWARMNIDNPSEIAQRIAMSQLSSLCRACGIAVIRDENELLGKACIAKVIVQKDRDDQNDIKAWLPISGTTPQATSFGKPAPTPVLDPPPPPTTKTVGSKPPWAR